jgi:hypothetical protein
MKAVKLIFILALLQGCTWYGEFEHISSIPNGTPFNDLNETSTDIVWTGLRVQQDTWYVDGALGYETSSEFEGRNPYGRIKIGKELKTWD